MDGNYKADHMKMKNPQDDVWIADGEGYFASDEVYKQHILMTKDHEEVKLHNIMHCIQS